MQQRVTLVAAEGKAPFVSVELNGKKYTVRPNKDEILVLCKDGIEARTTIVVNNVPRCIAIK